MARLIFLKEFRPSTDCKRIKCVTFDNSQYNDGGYHFFHQNDAGSFVRSTKAWFSNVGKIPDDRGFHFLPTIPDFAHISDNGHKSVPEMPCLCVIGDWGPKT